MNNAVYLLPGRGHRLSDLGDPVGRLGFDGYGRKLAPPLARLGFANLVGLEPQRSLHLVRRIRHARRTVRPVEALMRQIRRDPRDPTTIPFDADPRDLDHARFEDRLSEPLGVPVTLE